MSPEAKHRFDSSPWSYHEHKTTEGVVSEQLQIEDTTVPGRVPLQRGSSRKYHLAGTDESNSFACTSEIGDNGAVCQRHSICFGRRNVSGNKIIIFTYLKKLQVEEVINFQFQREIKRNECSFPYRFISCAFFKVLHFTSNKCCISFYFFKKVTPILYRERDMSEPTLPSKINVKKLYRDDKSPLVTLLLEKTLKRGSQCQVEIHFHGKLSNTSDGLFAHHYFDSTTGIKKWYVASHFRPNMARAAFPCFDEPAYKVPFIISVAREKKMTSLSNMPIVYTEEM